MLATISPSPVVELNRAVAVGMAGDPAGRLAIVNAVAKARSLRDYPQVPAVRAHLLGLLGLLGLTAESREAYLLAADVTRNEPEAALLRRRAAAAREA